MEKEHASILVLHPLTLRAIGSGPVQNPQPLRWYRYEGGTTSRPMAAYHRLPDGHPHYRLQRPTGLLAPLTWTWEDDS